MSFARFSNSDIYIFEHANGFIECCGCSLTDPDDGEIFGFAQLKTPREALAHLDLHEEADDDIGGARRRIEKAYEDLDVTIEPYVPDPEQQKRLDAYARGVKDERDRIVSQFKEYVEDLRLCSKKDSCADIAYAVQGQIEEITGEEMDDEEFIEGMAEAHDVVYTTLERLQQSLNDMMGVYMDMPEDITRQNPEVKELSVMHAVLNQFREMFNDNYDDAMREHKASKAWREDTDQLKSEWPE